MTEKRPFGLVLLAISVFLSAWLVGCGGASKPAARPAATDAPPLGVRAQAAAEATAIIEQAQATALVLQAQAQATALVQRAQAGESTPLPSVTRALPVFTSTPGEPAEQEPEATPAAGSLVATAGVTGTVELLAVSFGAEGAYVHIGFRAPPAVAQTFWPGVLSVTDEASGTVFNEVPVMPVIGPLIARPVEEGQIGYVMLVHNPPILRPGALVTVDLADYHFEHVPVR